MRQPMAKVGAGRHCRPALARQWPLVRRAGDLQRGIALCSVADGAGGRRCLPTAADLPAMASISKPRATAAPMPASPQSKPGAETRTFCTVVRGDGAFPSVDLALAFAGGDDGLP